MLENIFYIAIGLTLLVLGGNWLLKSSVAMSIKFNIPKAIIGMTVVSMATSFPELIVSLNAALSGSPLIAMGNVIGSNIANIGFILSVTALFSVVYISKQFLKSDYIILIGVSFLFLLLIMNFDVSRLDGLILLGTFVAYIIYLVISSNKQNVETEDSSMQDLPYWQIVVFLLIGGIGLWQGSEFLVKGAKAIATNMGVSERVIGVTVVAVGTSIPELAASLISIIKKENDISLGNIVGSNIFNTLLIMGTVSTIHPIQFEDPQVITDTYIMIGFTVLIAALAFVGKKYQIGRIKGLIIFTLYLTYIYHTFS